MSILKWETFIYLIVIHFALTACKPTSPSRSLPNRISRVKKRDLAQFTNFPDKDPKINQLQIAFTDMNTVASGVASSDPAKFDVVFAKYFKQDDNYKTAVKTIFQKMTTPSNVRPGTGADSLSQITIHGDDYASARKNCQRAMAYTDNVPNNPNAATMHFCDSDIRKTFKYPNLGSIKCSDLDTYASYKMQSLGGHVLLHELTHVNFISQAAVQIFSILPEKVVGDYAYGPQDTQKMAKSTSPMPIREIFPQTGATWQVATIGNADSLAWFANELYWSNKCNTLFKDKPQNNKNAPPGVCVDRDDGEGCIIL